MTPPEASLLSMCANGFRLCAETEAHMSRRVVGRFALPALTVLAFAIAGTSSEAEPSDAHTRFSVARVLERLSNYGAFDLLMLPSIAAP